MKGLIKGMPFIAAAMLLCHDGDADTLPGLEMLPDDTRYIECIHVNCTFTELEHRMVADVRTRLGGTYTYLLGNVDAAQVRTYRIEWAQERSFEDRETGVIETTPEVLRFDRVTNPSGYDAEFVTYAAMSKDPPVVNIPPSVATTMPTDIAGLADVAHHLRGLPQFNTVFSALSRITVTVVFPDGSTAKFQFISPFVGTGLSWVYVIGSAYDADGNPISVGDTSTSQQGPSANGGTGVGSGSVGSALGSSVTVYGPVVNLNGAARITVITVGGGPGEGPARRIVCINNVCIGT